ncbi:MAG: quinolinate synthase NadA [Pseudomonadota bacterium]
MNTINTIPDSYRGIDEAELDKRISSVRDKLGKDLCILGHYYQRDEVVKWADHQGDSFQLAKYGSETPAKHIVFCGVHFMAEASAILAKPGQRVFMPTLEAGCPLADMADIDQMQMAWRALEDVGAADDFVPVTYMNSSAAIKAFCGSVGGTVCTSSSAGKAFDWAAKQHKKVFFLPDENLGKNTALACGFKPEEIGVWDPNVADYAKQAMRSKEARTIVWKGFCHVHTFFTTEHVAKARSRYPGCKIVVHPECFPEVVDLSDANGSTSFLKKYAEDAPAGSTVVIGTEISFVNRIAKENPDKKVLPLARSLCPNMFRTSLADLCWVLEELGQVNEVRLPERVISEAKKALDRMLAL